VGPLVKNLGLRGLETLELEVWRLGGLEVTNVSSLQGFGGLKIPQTYDRGWVR